MNQEQTEAERIRFLLTGRKMNLRQAELMACTATVKLKIYTFYDGSRITVRDGGFLQQGTIRLLSVDQ